MQNIFQFIDDTKSETLKQLGDWVAIPSLSADPAYRDESLKACHWIKDFYEKLGGKTQIIYPMEGINPVLFAEFEGVDTSKTLLVYGHYDVQPAKMEDGWATDPFIMHESSEDGYLYGRGTMDDKGQFFAISKALESIIKTEGKLPINVKVICEGMEESGSEGLEEFIKAQKDTLLTGVTHVLICDTNWKDTKTPSVTHSLRGINYFEVTIHGHRNDLHSGSFGNLAWEPTNDIVHLFSKLRDGPMGNINIPGIYDGVVNLSDEYLKSLDDSGFDVDEYIQKNGLGGIAVPKTKRDVLMSTTFNPSLTIHGFGNVWTGPGAKTVLPGKATGYFSTRLVPNQDIELLAKNTLEFIESEFKKLGSPNRLEAKLIHGGSWWYADPDSEVMKLAKEALEEGFGVPATFDAEGGSIPITFTFQNEFGVTPVLMGLGHNYNNAHGPNERFHVDCLINGAKAVASFVKKISM